MFKSAFYLLEGTFAKAQTWYNMHEGGEKENGVAKQGTIH
jgi:hypothetical protein